MPDITPSFMPPDMSPLATQFMTGGQMGYMPQAQYLTPSSYGGFRTPVMSPLQNTIGGNVGFWQSAIMASNSGSTLYYNPALNPIRSRYEAMQRKNDYLGSAAINALDFGGNALAGMAIGTAIGGPIGGAVGFAASMMLPDDILYRNIIERRRAAMNIQRASNNFIVSGPDMNLVTGQGFNMRAAHRIERSLYRQALRDPVFEAGDYQSMLLNSMEAGLMDYAGSADQYLDKFKTLRKSMTTMMRVLGSTDFKDLAKEFKRLQDMGVDMSLYRDVAKRENTYARITGIDHRTMVDVYGRRGEAIFQQAGLSRAQGNDFGQLARALVTLAQRSGQVSESFMAAAGGEDGLAQSVTEQTAAAARMYQDKLLMAALDPRTLQLRRGFDINAYLRGGGLTDLINEAGSNANDIMRDPAQYLRFRARLPELQNELAKRVGDVSMQNGYIARMLGKSLRPELSERDQMLTGFGAMGFEQNAVFMTDTFQQQRQQMEQEERIQREQDRQEYEREHVWWRRFMREVGATIKEGFADIFEEVSDTVGLGTRADLEAAHKMGQTYYDASMFNSGSGTNPAGTGVRMPNPATARYTDNTSGMTTSQLIQVADNELTRLTMGQYGTDWMIKDSGVSALNVYNGKLFSDGKGGHDAQAFYNMLNGAGLLGEIEKITGQPVTVESLEALRLSALNDYSTNGIGGIGDKTKQLNAIMSRLFKSYDPFRDRVNVFRSRWNTDLNGVTGVSGITDKTALMHLKALQRDTGMDILGDANSMTARFLAGSLGLSDKDIAGIGLSKEATAALAEIMSASDPAAALQALLNSGGAAATGAQEALFSFMQQDLARYYNGAVPGGYFVKGGEGERFMRAAARINDIRSTAAKMGGNPFGFSDIGLGAVRGDIVRMASNVLAAGQKGPNTYWNVLNRDTGRMSSIVRASTASSEADSRISLRGSLSNFVSGIKGLTVGDQDAVINEIIQQIVHGDIDVNDGDAFLQKIPDIIYNALGLSGRIEGQSAFARRFDTDSNARAFMDDILRMAYILSPEDSTFHKSMRQSVSTANTNRFSAEEDALQALIARYMPTTAFEQQNKAARFIAFAGKGTAGDLSSVITGLQSGLKKTGDADALWDYIKDTKAGSADRYKKVFKWLSENEYGEFVSGMYDASSGSLRDGVLAGLKGIDVDFAGDSFGYDLQATKPKIGTAVAGLVGMVQRLRSLTPELGNIKLSDLDSESGLSSFIADVRNRAAGAEEGSDIKTLAKLLQDFTGSNVLELGAYLGEHGYSLKGNMTGGDIADKMFGDVSATSEKLEAVAETSKNASDTMKGAADSMGEHVEEFGRIVAALGEITDPGNMHHALVKYRSNNQK